MVTKQERLVYEQVLERDRVMTWETRQTGPLGSYLLGGPWVCVAPLIDPSLWGSCSGMMERDHVWQHAGGTKSKRPPTTMETLVVLCHHHHQDGWATSHRPKIRKYIGEANVRYRQVQADHES